MDQLDTGVLICHLARIIQSKAREIIESMSTATSTVQSSPQHTNSVEQTEEIVTPQFEQFRDLQALLRSANTNSSLLAAAKVIKRHNRSLLLRRLRCWWILKIKSGEAGKTADQTREKELWRWRILVSAFIGQIWRPFGPNSRPADDDGLCAQCSCGPLYQFDEVSEWTVAKV